jgi:predicted CoA-binding protein
MTTLNQIQKFLAPRKFAIVGVSRNPKKWGGAIFKELTEKGFELYPVNPNADEIQGVKCYNSVSDLPDDVKYIHITTKKTETEEVVKAAIEKGIEMIWIQQGSQTTEAVEIAEKAGIQLIYKKCIMMFAEPVKSIHGFHRSLVKLFGGYPKMVTPSVN